jgi:hypothetical protein
LLSKNKIIDFTQTNFFDLVNEFSLTHKLDYFMMPVCKMNKFFDFLFAKFVWTDEKNKIEFLDELSD